MTRRPPRTTPTATRLPYTTLFRSLKEGIVEDATNRERIAKLLRFASTKGDGAAQTVSLDAYVGRMAPGQDAIWYVTADGHRAAAGSPQLEAFRAKDIEVL